MIIEDFEGNKFKYTENGIEYPTDKVLPNELYKYYAFNKYSIDAFVNNYLFFSHPDMLNDLIDSTKFLLDFSNFSWLSIVIPVYKFIRVIKMDKLLKNILLPSQYKIQINELDIHTK